MRSHPFANLISNDDRGLPYVTHLPLHLVLPRTGRCFRCVTPGPKVLPSCADREACLRVPSQALAMMPAGNVLT